VLLPRRNEPVLVRHDHPMTITHVKLTT
jgi:hypothetical protein